MSYPLPLTRTEAYLAYKAGVIQQSELKPSLAVPRIGIDAWLAYWTQLANDYPKNPDGTPKMLQEEEEYIAYLCGVTDTYPEECLRRVGAYLRYIISARWDRPDHPLNREELYLSLIKTQFIPSGDPSSDIVIDGTTKAPFVDVKLYGDTFQQSYTGKNLLGLGNPETFTYGLDVTVAEESGTITVDGTFTGGGGGFPWVSDKQLNIPAGTYTLSMKNPQSFNVSLRMFDAQGQYTGGKYIATGATSGTFTLDYDCVRVGVLIGGFSVGDTLDNQKIEGLQLEAGSTATSFEPYVGGIPSPNPDYPQPIQTVTGLQTVEIQGKNKYPFNNTSWSSTAESATWCFQDGALNAYGANVTDKTDYKLTLPAGTYTVSAYDIDSNLIRIQVVSNGESVETLLINSITSEAPSATITLTEPTTICVRYRPTTPSLGIGNTKIQIEQGSTPTDYAPYSKQTYTIDLGDIELNNLDDTYVDYIWEDMGDWKIRKNTSRFTFETRKLAGLSKQNLGFVYNAGNNPLEGKHIPLVGKCSHFDVETIDTPWTGQNKTGMNSGGALWFMTTDTSQGDTRTSEEFGQWLVDAGVSFVYALETPTDTVITNQALIDQLNALKQGGAEEGTTYIKVSATDPNLPAKLYVEAPKYD